MYLVCEVSAAPLPQRSAVFHKSPALVSTNGRRYIITSRIKYITVKFKQAKGQGEESTTWMAHLGEVTETSVFPSRLSWRLTFKGILSLLQAQPQRHWAVPRGHLPWWFQYCYRQTCPLSGGSGSHVRAEETERGLLGRGPSRCRPPGCVQRAGQVTGSSGFVRSDGAVSGSGLCQHRPSGENRAAPPRGGNKEGPPHPPTPHSNKAGQEGSGLAQGGGLGMPKGR